MKKILVTGSTGLLGSTLVPYLKYRGYNVVTLARTGLADFYIDLAKGHKCNELLTQIQPSLIINLVGLTNVDLCQEQPNAAYLANILTVENLSAWMLQSGVNCHLVHISTDQVYDDIGPHAESQVCLKNDYALSKYAGELAASRVSSTILRTNFIGRSKTSNRISFTDWLYSSLISGTPIQVFNDIVFSPLSMRSLAEMIELIIEKKPVGIYNLGSLRGMSKAEFSFAFAEYLGLSTSSLRRIDSSQTTFLKAYRPKDMRMLCSKIENAMSIKLLLMKFNKLH